MLCTRYNAGINQRLLYSHLQLLRGYGSRGQYETFPDVLSGNKK